MKQYFGQYNKVLAVDQMFGLLAKPSSENPLWLSMACEELRVYGEFRNLQGFITQLQDGLDGWVMHYTEPFLCSKFYDCCGRLPT